MAYKSQLPPGGDGFGRLVLAEWTKFRTVRRWTVAMLAAVALTVLMAVLGAQAKFENTSTPAIGPEGGTVADRFEFAHQPLDGDGSITARILAQTVSETPTPGWAKAGVIIKDGLRPGASYAAMMATAAHGVRMQWNFTHDRAGTAGPLPRWLRLTRSGDVITGHESADGRSWRQVGSVVLEGLPRRVEMGLFATTPGALRHERGFTSTSVGAVATSTTARFSDVSLTPGQWRADHVGFGGGVADPKSEPPGEVREAGGGFTVTGSGDIAPDELGADRVRLPLSGVVGGMLVTAVLGVLFITTEYRRGMIRTTLVASPRRGRVLAAKAVVLAGVTFAAGLVASVIGLLAAQPTLRGGGLKPPWFPAPSAGDPKVLLAVVGTAALVALYAVFSLGLGAVLRRSAAPIAILTVLLVVPNLIVGALPIDTGVWILRLTPVAGFSVQNPTNRYDHIDTLCLPEDNCIYLQQWPGLAVLGGYAAACLLAGIWLIRRREA